MPYTFLVNPAKPQSKAHIWKDGHTLCVMSKLRGFDRARYQTTNDLGDHRLCEECADGERRTDNSGELER